MSKWHRLSAGHYAAERAGVRADITRANTNAATPWLLVEGPWGRQQAVGAYATLAAAKRDALLEIRPKRTGVLDDPRLAGTYRRRHTHLLTGRCR